MASSILVERVLKIDDPLDAFAVHACGGMLGLIVVGVFADQELVANAYGDMAAEEPNAYGEPLALPACCPWNW